jgi:hypothetical protein
MADSGLRPDIFFPYVADAEGAELLASRRALVLAKEMQVCARKWVEAKLLKEEVDRSANAQLCNTRRTP